MKKVIYLWLNTILVIVVVGIISFVTFTNSLNYSFYAQQDQLALQASELLNEGKTVDNLLADTTVGTNHTPFLVVYNLDNSVKYTNATYEDKPLSLPLSIALTRTPQPIHNIWTPTSSTSYSISSISYDEGFLAVGINNDLLLNSIKNGQNLIIYLSGGLILISLPCIIGIRKLCKIA